MNTFYNKLSTAVILSKTQWHCSIEGKDKASLMSLLWSCEGNNVKRLQESPARWDVSLSDCIMDIYSTYLTISSVPVEGVQILKIHPSSRSPPRRLFLKI